MVFMHQVSLFIFSYACFSLWGVSGGHNFEENYHLKLDVRKYWMISKLNGRLTHNLWICIV